MDSKTAFSGATGAAFTDYGPLDMRGFVWYVAFVNAISKELKETIMGTPLKPMTVKVKRRRKYDAETTVETGTNSLKKIIMATNFPHF